MHLRLLSFVLLLSACPATSTTVPGTSGACTLCVPGAWDVERVALGSTPTLAIGADGVAHVAYRDSESGALMYARRTNTGSWETELVPNTGPTVVGYVADIAVDEVGGVHIAFQDEQPRIQAYAHKPLGGSWAVSHIDDQGNSGWNPSIAVGRNGVVSIAYVTYEAPSSEDLGLHFAVGSATDGWEITSGLDINGWDPSIWLDPSGSLDVAYSDLSQPSHLSHGQLTYTGEWSSWPVDGVGGGLSALAVGQDGTVHISSADSVDGLFYTRIGPDGGASTRQIASADDTGMDSAIQIDCAGGVHILYAGGFENDYFVYEQISAEGELRWDELEGVSTTPDSAMHPDGAIRLLFTDLDGALAYATPSCL